LVSGIAAFKMSSSLTEQGLRSLKLSESCKKNDDHHSSHNFFAMLIL